jgi:hypothetical protein
VCAIGSNVRAIGSNVSAAGSNVCAIGSNVSAAGSIVSAADSIVSAAADTYAPPQVRIRRGGLPCTRGRADVVPRPPRSRPPGAWARSRAGWSLGWPKT